MSASYHDRNCSCLDCRLRRALRADDAPAAEDGMVPVDPREALEALCRVTSELLAHHSGAETKAFFHKLIDYREQWKKAAHVMVQREARGAA